MSTDRHEQARRGQDGKAKRSNAHPFTAIENRVLESPAYADLNFAARSLLTLIARQLTWDNNNGHLQATYSFLKRFGFGSEHTISRAIQELIAHGFIYRTRMGGYERGPSLYAVTWKPIKHSEGLFLDGFLTCAWRHWDPKEKKMTSPKCAAHPLH